MLQQLRCHTDSGGLLHMDIAFLLQVQVHVPRTYLPRGHMVTHLLIYAANATGQVPAGGRSGKGMGERLWNFNGVFEV